jgi:hypothetical protein
MKFLLLTLALTATGFAETHRFEPTEFYNTFSGEHKPVLRIKPGGGIPKEVSNSGCECEGVVATDLSQQISGLFDRRQ